MILSAGDSLKMDCRCLSTPGSREGDVALWGKDAMGTSENPSDNGPGAMGNRNVGCDRHELAPILQFGSGFVHPEVVPSLITMPVWTHVSCFETFKFEKEVCGRFREFSEENRRGIQFGEHFREVASELEGGNANGGDDGVGDAGYYLEERPDDLEDGESTLPQEISRRLRRVSIYDYLIPQIIWR